MAEVQATPASIEVNDAVFCTHFKEVCAECNADFREENDAFFGFDPIDREGLESPVVTQNKEGVYQCKKHGSSGCGQCLGFKKQLTRLRQQAKKAGKK
ncbi:hypothetical protein C8J56DRAFT_1005542 [Mycena floridula]|nr:hypothetical protein C8J56DRAFT_1005542 [Mycena floridula]